MSSRQRSILGMTSCSSRIAWSTRASVEKPVLPRRFFDSPSLLKSTSPSCCGEPMTNSSPRQPVDVVLEVADLGPDAVADLLQARDVQPDAGLLHPAQRVDERQLDLVHERRRGPSSSSRARCQAASSRSRTASAAAGSCTSVASPRSSTSSRTGKRAARRLDQVGGEQRVVGQVGRDDLEGLRVVRGDRALVGGEHDLPRRVAVAGEHLVGRRDAEAPCVARPAAAPPRASPAGGRRWSPASAAARPRRSGSPARSGELTTCSGTGGGAASSSPSASSSRRSGSRSSKSRKTSRRRARSGVRASASCRSISTGTSYCAWASCLEIRASSAWFVRFSLRLAPEIWSMLASTVSRSPNCWSSVRRRLVADAGDARDVVRRVALQPVEVGDRLGRDAVAVDHGLAVVGLRLGDPARGGHDLHAVADELERVAVAGDHRDRDPLGLRPLGDRGDDVVGLEAVDAVVRVAEGLDQRLHVRVLLGEQVGARRPVALVLGVDLAPPARPGVPHDDRRLLAVLGQQLHEHRGEAEDRVRRAARRRWRSTRAARRRRGTRASCRRSGTALAGCRRWRATAPS